jgi:hypothetical protein
VLRAPEKSVSKVLGRLDFTTPSELGLVQIKLEQAGSEDPQSHAVEIACHAGVMQLQ